MVSGRHQAFSSVACLSFWMLTFSFSTMFLNQRKTEMQSWNWNIPQNIHCQSTEDTPMFLLSFDKNKHRKRGAWYVDQSFWVVSTFMHWNKEKRWRVDWLLHCNIGLLRPDKQQKFWAWTSSKIVRLTLFYVSAFVGSPSRNCLSQRARRPAKQPSLFNRHFESPSCPITPQTAPLYQQQRGAPDTRHQLGGACLAHKSSFTKSWLQGGWQREGEEGDVVGRKRSLQVRCVVSPTQLRVLQRCVTHPEKKTTQLAQEVPPACRVRCEPTRAGSTDGDATDNATLIPTPTVPATSAAPRPGWARGVLGLRGQGGIKLRELEKILHCFWTSGTGCLSFVFIVFVHPSGNAISSNRLVETRTT